MPRSPSHARDAALKRMRRINRWLVAGAVIVTGLLTDVAAQAFPGRTITRSAGSPSTTRPGRAIPAPTTIRHRPAEHRALKPPTQAPQAQNPPQVVEPVAGATPSLGTQTPAAPTPAAPTPAAPTPAAAAAPAPVAPAPVVSGGS
jgi:hypothetical protein